TILPLLSHSGPRLASLTPSGPGWEKSEAIWCGLNRVLGGADSLWSPVRVSTLAPVPAPFPLPLGPHPAKSRSKPKKRARAAHLLIRTLTASQDTKARGRGPPFARVVGRPKGS